MKKRTRQTMNRFRMRAIAFVVVFAMALSAAASMPMDVFAEYGDLDTINNYSYFNGHTYSVIDKALDWYEAKGYCENLGGHLVTITSEDENVFVFNLVQDSSCEAYYLWIGASDSDNEGEWKWITDETFVYTNWDSGQPDNLSGVDNAEEDYLTFLRSNGRWNDLQSTGDSYGGSQLSESAFICEWDYLVTNPDYNFFVLARDNNNFNHTTSFFCDGDEKRGYIISDEYFNILLNKVSPFQKNNLKLARNKEWGGSCFGLSASMVLANRGLISDITNNGTYFNIDLAEAENKNNLIHTINYYQLANNAFIIKKDHWHDEQLSPVGSRASFLKSLVEEAKKCSLTQTPFLFMYTYNEKKGLSKKAVKYIDKKYKEILKEKYNYSGGHCVIVCGYSYDANNDKPHKIKIYDPNARDTYRYMYIGENYYDFSYVDGNMADFPDLLEVLGYSDWQSESLDLKDIVTELYYASMRNMNQASGNNEKTSIMISLNSPFDLTLANGTIIKYDGINFETSDKNAILDYQINADSNFAYLYLEVSSTNKIVISGDDIDVSAYINSEFYMAKVNNAENVVFDATNGLKINGESFDFDIAADTNLKSTSLTEVTGSAHGNVTMYDNEDGVKCQFDGDHGNLSVNAYSDSDATTMMVENTGGFIICDDHNNHNTIIKTDNETVLQGDLNNDGIVNAKDSAILAAAFGKRKGNSGYNEAADFNNDGIINAKDKAIISANFGKRK